MVVTVVQQMTSYRDSDVKIDVCLGFLSWQGNLWSFGTIIMVPKLLCKHTQ